jgi:hypothetical protein
VNYTTADAVAAYNTVLTEAREHGADVAFSNARSLDPELLALALTLATLSRDYLL